MATFCTKKTLYGNPALIATIAKSINDECQSEGYEVALDALSSGGYDISISKGGIFKAVMGMKTALKISLLPRGGNIYFEAGVGIWGQQVIPTIISMFFFWPILITQIWGIVKQSQLDDKALDIANAVISTHSNSTATTLHSGTKFCPYCGTENPADANFCKLDGKPI